MSIREATLSAAERRRIRRLESIDDTALGVRLFQGVPTNESRSPELLGDWSRKAQSFGRQLADAVAGGVVDPALGVVAADDVRVVERDGGLDDGDPVIARYNSKTHEVDLFTDSVAYCELLVDELGWRDLFAPGAIREAAIAHERAHELIGRDRARALREAIGHDVLHIGRFRRFAYVAGADELAAHAFAQRTLGLTRSPLLITAAAMAALDGAVTDDTAADPTRKEN